MTATLDSLTQIEMVEEPSNATDDTSFEVLNVGLVVLALAAGVATAFGVPGGSWIDTTSRFFLAALLGLIAFVIARSIGRVPEEGRRGWSIIGYAINALVVAEITYVLMGPGDFPTVADGLVIAFALVSAVGLFLLPHVTGSRYSRFRLALDATAGTVAVAALIVEWVVAGSGRTWSTVDLGLLARPVSALVLCGGLMVVAVRRSPYRFDRRLIAFAVGLGMLIAAEILSPIVEARAVDGDGSVVALKFAAAAAFGVMAWTMRRPVARRDMAMIRPDSWRLMAPYGLVVVMFGVFFGRVVSDSDRLDGPLPWGALLVALIIVVRLAVATRENRELIELERDQLIAAVSHELRTPLTAVAGFSDVIWDEWGRLTESEAREMVDIIRFQAHYLSGIVTDIVALVRNDLESVRLERERIEAKTLIGDAIKAVFDLNAGPVPVTAQVEPFMEVVGDRERLTQVLIALLKNAQRYGAGRILVVARRTDDGRYFEVHDDGDGVPVKYEQLVWERFERGAHRLNANVPGSGLGLAIVRAVARAHGGRADYRRSERLGGACFTIEIPYDPDLR